VALFRASFGVKLANADSKVNEVLWDSWTMMVSERELR
jgi:hypothetical protein